MRIINKKYLLIVLLIGIILTGVIFLKPKEEVKLDNVILKQEVNNKTFAMYTETDSGYEEYKDTKFPDMYVLNIELSKCIDNNGNELKDVLSYENDKVTITSGNTTYCYLYFDKSLGLEIKELSPKGLSIDKVRGAMYRFQGQAKDENENELVDNYICFGTSDKEQCKQDTNHYMYRIIGIEASTGRVKVIKKETLKETESETYQWWENYDDDKTFPESKIYEAISGDAFLKNKDYVPYGWEEKIANNTWMYGDMHSNNTIGASQTGEGLYLAETGQKGTIWDAKANEGDPSALSYVVENESHPYRGQKVYYIRHYDEKWTDTFEGKVSLMYLHDYHYSVSDTANCQYNAGAYNECKTGWMHLSQNDLSVTVNGVGEWTMSRSGWLNWDVFFGGFLVTGKGYINSWGLDNSLYVRPVFYLASINELTGGTGTDIDPFIIKS